jgi:hypothetical protein
MPLPKWLSITFLIIGAIVAVSFLEGWGLVGIIIFLLIIVLYQMYNGRHSIQAGMENIETQIFGKPLHKDYWERGELKNHRVKIIWKKKKDK